MILASSQQIIRRLFVSILFLMTCLLAAFSWYALISFEKSFVPEIHKKAELIAEKIAADVQQAVGYGIPLDQLAGMKPYLNEFVEENKDIGHIQISRNSQIIYGAETEVSFSEPDEILSIELEGAGSVSIEVFLSKSYLQDKFSTVAIDQITALFIAILIAFEVLCFIVYGRIFNPLALIEKVIEKTRQGDFSQTIRCRASAEMERLETRINAYLYDLAERRRDVLDNARELKTVQFIDAPRQKITEITDNVISTVKVSEPYGFKDLTTDNLRSFRFPLFLFMFAEELSRPFLPLLARGFELPDFIKDQAELAAGIPIALFMGVVVLVSLISGPWVEKYGAKKLFIFGVVPAFLGYVGVYFASDYISFLAARALSAFGYALVFVSGQSFFASRSSPENRASNMALFVGAILVAGITGPAIGGIMAFKIGYGETFIMSALLVLISFIFIIHAIDQDPLNAYKTKELEGPQKRRALLGHIPFMSLSLLCAVPAKIMLTGVLFLLTPLYLIELGSNESTIGRVLIVYGIVIVLALPQISKLADRFKNHNNMVILGGLIAASGALLFLVGSGLWMMTLCVALVGFGQAFSMATQLAEIQKILQKPDVPVALSTGMGMFRSLERSGSVIGPLFAGSLALAFDIETAIIIIGLYAAISFGLHALLSLKWKG